MLKNYAIFKNWIFRAKLQSNNFWSKVQPVNRSYTFSRWNLLSRIFFYPRWLHFFMLYFYVFILSSENVVALSRTLEHSYRIRTFMYISTIAHTSTDLRRPSHLFVHPWAQSYTLHYIQVFTDDIFPIFPLMISKFRS